MKIDYETGNIESVSYESYEAMQEEKDNEIEKLKQENEDLRDRVAELEEHVEFVDKLLKKDSLVAPNESK